MLSNSRLAETEGWLSIGVNTLLFILKYWAGVVTGSLALVADAWHTLSDSISSVFVIFGVKLSGKPADKKHPFGHGRTELITSILIGAMLAFVAFYFFQEGVARLRLHEMVKYGPIAIIATVTSIAMKEGLAQYAFIIGRKSRSQSVFADGWHHRSDALSSVVVLAGIFLGKYFWWIDGILGIIVAILIFYAAYKVIMDAAGVILGEEPSEEVIGEVTKIVGEIARIELDPHHFHLHNYVQHQELTFHVRFPRGMQIDEAHQIVSEIEYEIHRKLNIDATIHIEPAKSAEVHNHED